MPVIKNALSRYYLINDCLTNVLKRYWSMEELMEKGEERDIIVGKRTIEHDLEAMRYDDQLKYYAPISYCKRNKGFHYTDLNYSIEKLPLTESDIETFEVMLEAVQRFRGGGQLSSVEGMFDKLVKVVQQLKPKKKKAAYPVVAFEQVPYYKGIEHFDIVYRAILKQTVLAIEYKKFDHEEAKEHVFHPYLLKEYKFRWYVLGYSEKRKSKLLLALDRIESITVKKMAFKPYKGIDIQKYFDHSLGVTINNTGVREIKLWFSASQANYIKTQHLHATQQIITDDTKGLVMTLQLIPNYELLHLLLSYGAEVKVLEPESLREEMKEVLRKSLELYE